MKTPAHELLSEPKTMPAEIPAHVFVYKTGRVWAALCTRYARFLAASPNAANLRAAAVLHNCGMKKTPKRVA